LEAWDLGEKRRDEADRHLIAIRHTKPPTQILNISTAKQLHVSD